MNKQMIFDTVRAHLLRQNRPSVNDIGCAYRGEGGTMCAVGCLIDDRYYDPHFEGDNLISRDVQKALELSGISATTDDGQLNEIGRLLEDLQQAHDKVADTLVVPDSGGCFRERIEQQLAHLAQVYDLKMEPLT